MTDVGRIIFFGTPEFAVPTLDALCVAGLEPTLVVSQPARRFGRRARLKEPPVALYAFERGLELAQPESVGRADFLESVRRLEPAFAVVVAFGQIFPPALLALPSIGCVNLHASLLPRHRGAAPIQAAIAAGDRCTGVTTMQMDEGLDTGAILLSGELEIGPRDTAGDLASRLARLGAPLVVKTLRALAAGELEPQPQDESLATYAPLLHRQDGRLDWELPAARLERLVRAYSPWPGTSAVLRGESVKVIEADLVPEEAPLDSTAVDGAAVATVAGLVVGLVGESLHVLCGDRRVLALRRLQRPGRRPVSGAELANGLRLAAGERLG